MGQLIDIAAIVGVMLGVLSLALICHLGTLHNNLVAEFREDVQRWEVDGEPSADDDNADDGFSDEEIQRLVEIATGRRPVDKPNGGAR